MNKRIEEEAVVAMKMAEEIINAPDPWGRKNFIEKISETLIKIWVFFKKFFTKNPSAHPCANCVGARYYAASQAPTPAPEPEPRQYERFEKIVAEERRRVEEGLSDNDRRLFNNSTTCAGGGGLYMIYAPRVARRCREEGVEIPPNKRDIYKEAPIPVAKNGVEGYPCGSCRGHERCEVTCPKWARAISHLSHR